MLKRFLVICIACAACGLFAGCAKYYRISDLSNGNQYYTQSFTERRGGALVFKDSRTGNQVTLTSTEIAEVSKEEFTYGGEKEEK